MEEQTTPAGRFRQTELETYREMGTLFENQDEQIEWTVRRERIARIQEVRRRLKEGSYGMCEVCGQPIESERLTAWPFATTCIRCARR